MNNRFNTIIPNVSGISTMFNKKVKFPVRLSKLKLGLEPKFFNAKIAVKGSKPLINWYLLLIKVVAGELTPNWVRITVVLFRDLHLILRTQGLQGYVKYLKASCILIQQVISGHKIHDMSGLGSRFRRSKSGLPRILPIVVRRRILEGDVILIKVILTILSVFRVTLYPSDPKFSTITNPKTVSMQGERFISRFLDRALSALIKPSDMIKPLSLDSNLSQQLSSSANSNWKNNEYSTHPFSIIKSSIALWNFPKVRDSLNYLINLYPGSHLDKMWTSTNKLVGLMLADASQRDFKNLFDKFYNPSFIKRVGKIGLKQEAAGKVRIFAMVDPFTQWVLKPLHKRIFSFLRKIPMDGTFDQLKPLSKVKLETPKFSFDLSAATDRLPLSFQKKIVGKLVNQAYSENWATVLVGRPYYVKEAFKEAKLLHYNVGQPMGALSSWAMLALTHHVLVQIAAILSGTRIPFKGYGLLGDDIVIFDSNVAKYYLRIMKILGLEINLSKSVLSPSGKGLEFAKKTIFKGKDVSPISLKELSAALKTSASLVSFVKKYNVNFSTIKSLLGLGYRSSSVTKRLKLFFIAMSVPTDAHSFKTLLIRAYRKEGTGPGSTIVTLIDSLRELLIIQQENLVKDSRALKVFIAKSLVNDPIKELFNKYWTLEESLRYVTRDLSKLSEEQLKKLIYVSPELYYLPKDSPEFQSEGLAFKHNSQVVMEEIFTHPSIHSEPLFYSDFDPKIQLPIPNTKLASNYLQDILKGRVDIALGFNAIKKIEQLLIDNRTILIKCIEYLGTLQNNRASLLSLLSEKRDSFRGMNSKVNRLNDLRLRNHIFKHTQHFDLPELSGIDIVNVFDKCIDEYYRIDNEVSNLQVRDIISPKNKESISPSLKEEKRLNILWKTWSNSILVKDEKILHSAIPLMLPLTFLLKLVIKPAWSITKIMLFSPISGAVRMLRFPSFYRPIILGRNATPFTWRVLALFLGLETLYTTLLWGILCFGIILVLTLYQYMVGDKMSFMPLLTVAFNSGTSWISTITEYYSFLFMGKEVGYNWFRYFFIGISLPFIHTVITHITEIYNCYSWLLNPLHFDIMTPVAFIATSFAVFQAYCLDPVLNIVMIPAVIIKEGIKGIIPHLYSGNVWMKDILYRIIPFKADLLYLRNGLTNISPFNFTETLVEFTEQKGVLGEDKPSFPKTDEEEIKTSSSSKPKCFDKYFKDPNTVEQVTSSTSSSDVLETQATWEDQDTSYDGFINIIPDHIDPWYKRPFVVMSNHPYIVASIFIQVSIFSIKRIIPLVTS